MKKDNKLTLLLITTPAPFIVLLLSTHQTDLLHCDGLRAVPSSLLPSSLWGPVSRPGSLPPRQGQFVEEGQLLAHAQLAALVAILL